MLCGTEPHPKDFKAKKYKIDKHTLKKEEFYHIMKNLPVHVEDADIDEMFRYADSDSDGQLSYSEFLVMVNPPTPHQLPKPSMADLGLAPQPFSPPPGQTGPHSL